MKFFTSLAGALALSGATIAAALPKHTTYSGVVTDSDVLNYALTLEHLEDKFYRDGLMNFTQKQFADAGFDATFYQNLKEISYDETTHVSFLTTALHGNCPETSCIIWAIANILHSCWCCSSHGMQIRFWSHLCSHIRRNCIDTRGRWCFSM
jgi:hypothetical protein